MVADQPTSNGTATRSPGAAAHPAVALGLTRLVDCVYSEVRLPAGQEQVDYLISFTRKSAILVRDALVGNTRQLGLVSERWQLLERLVAGWAGVETALKDVPIAWFEFDDVASGWNFRCPSVSVCLVPGYDAGHGLGTGSPLARQVCRTSLELLGGDARQRDSLDAAFHHLPAGARWIHFSYMLGRDPRAAKLYGVIARDQLLRYLSELGWAGDFNELSFVLEELYPTELLGQELYLDLNLANFQDPRECTLGLAVAQQHLASGFDADPLRSRLLERWVSAGLCDAHKVAMARAWPLTGGRVCPFESDFRFLDLKLVWQSKRGLLAKAYWGRQKLRGLFS